MHVSYKVAPFCSCCCCDESRRTTLRRTGELPWCGCQLTTELQQAVVTFFQKRILVTFTWTSNLKASVVYECEWCDEATPPTPLHPPHVGMGEES